MNGRLNEIPEEIGELEKSVREGILRKGKKI